MASSERATSRELEHAAALLAAGDVRGSAAAAQILVRRYPADPHVWHLLSGIYLRVGQVASAQGCAARAIALAPAEPLYLIQQAQCLAILGDRRRGLDAAHRAAALRRSDAALLDALGTAFTLCDEPALAVPLFAAAVAIAPEDARCLYNLAAAQRMTGDFGAAEAHLNHAIEVDPTDAQAYHLRSSLRRQTDTANHVQELSALLERGTGATTDEAAVCFALAKELEDLGRDLGSIAYLKRGSQLKRQSFRYNVQDDVASLDRIIARFDQEAINSHSGFESTEPLFIVGLPRSGTTLLEQILAGHESVTAAGELPAFPFVLNESIRAMPRASEALDVGDAGLLLEPAALGRAYLDATRPRTGKTPHFVDKLPNNYLHIGLLKRALPNARFIALARDPLDSCYAMYKTLFTDAYPFTYDLVELGEYYAAWHRLMRHWKTVLGESLLIVSYENLVMAPEEVTRTVLAHCDLPWQAACLQFHQNAGAVTTASAAQVRQPLYASSIGKWRRVDAALRPLIDTLERLEPEEGWHFAPQPRSTRR